MTADAFSLYMVLRLQKIPSMLFLRRYKYLFENAKPIIGGLHMYKHERGLRITSILLIIYGGSYCVSLLLFIFLSSKYMELGWDIVVMYIVTCATIAALDILAGITGLRIINRKGSEKLFTVLAYSLLVIYLIELIFGFVIPPLEIRDITRPVIHILITVLYLKNGHGLQYDRRIRDIQSDT